jgi:hypothetical protein
LRPQGCHAPTSRLGRHRRGLCAVPCRSSHPLRARMSSLAFFAAVIVFHVLIRFRAVIRIVHIGHATFVEGSSVRRSLQNLLAFVGVCDVMAFRPLIARTSWTKPCASPARPSCRGCWGRAEAAGAYGAWPLPSAVRVGKTLGRGRRKEGLRFMMRVRAAY